MTQEIPKKPDINDYGLDISKKSQYEALLQKNERIENYFLIGFSIIILIIISFILFFDLPDTTKRLPELYQSDFRIMALLMVILIASSVIQVAVIFLFVFTPCVISKLIIGKSNSDLVEKYSSFKGESMDYYYKVCEFWTNFPKPGKHGEQIKDYLKDVEKKRIENEQLINGKPLIDRPINSNHDKLHEIYRRIWGN